MRSFSIHLLLNAAEEGLIMSAVAAIGRHERVSLLAEEPTLIAYPAPEFPPAPKDFEEEVTAILRQSGRRMTPWEIISQLRQHGFDYSSHTVKTYLSRLVAHGVLVSNRRKPFGYCLAGNRPCGPVSASVNDILDTLREIGFRMTKPVLLAALGERGLRWDGGELSSQLAQLVYAGQLNCDPYSKPPGYGFPEWG